MLKERTTEENMDGSNIKDIDVKYLNENILLDRNK